MSEDRPSSIQIEFARPEEASQILDVARSAAVFNEEDIATLDELLRAYQAAGVGSGYYFLVCRQAGQVVGFACYGPRWLTQGTFDLYWIGCRPGLQGQGIGSALLRQSEHNMRAAGGRLVMIDTSTRPEYAPARSFYEAHRYRCEAIIEDFYAEGDGLALYSKRLAV